MGGDVAHCNANMTEVDKDKDNAPTPSSHVEGGPSTWLDGVGAIGAPSSHVEGLGVGVKPPAPVKCKVEGADRE